MASSPGSPGVLPEVWLFALGALFVLVTLFLPRGHCRHHPASQGRRADRHKAVAKPMLPADMPPKSPSQVTLEKAGA